MAMNVNDLVAQAVVPQLTGAIFRANGCDDPVGCLVLGNTFFSHLEQVLEGGDFLPILEDDFFNGEALLDGKSVEYGDDIDPEVLLVKAGIITEEGEVTDFLTKVLSENAKYRPHLAGTEFTRKRPIANENTPSELLVKAVEHLEGSSHNNNKRMLGILNEAFDAVDDDHEFKDQKWLLDACNEMDEDGFYQDSFCTDRKAGRIHKATYHGTPNEGDLGGALYEIKGFKGMEDPQEAHAFLLWNMRNEVAKCFKTDKAFDKQVKKANANPVKFFIKNYDREGLKVATFVRTADLLVKLEAFIKGEGPEPYFGYLMGMDFKCSGSQIGALQTGDHKIAAMCGISLTKGKDIYEVAADRLKLVGFSSITRDGMKDGFNPLLYGQTPRGLCNVRKVRKQSPELCELMHGDCAPGQYDEAKARLVSGEVSKALGKITTLRKNMKEYTYDFKTNSNLINEPVVFYSPDGSKVNPRLMVSVNLDGEVAKGDVENPAAKIVLPNGLSAYYDEFTLETDLYDLPKYGRDGCVTLFHNTDVLLLKLIVVKLKEKGVVHVYTNHDCFYVDINSQYLLVDAIKEAMVELFCSEGDFPTENLPLGTDSIKLWFDGAAESRIVKMAVRTTQFWGHPTIRNGKKRGKVGGTRRFISEKPKGDTALIDIINSLVHPKDRVDGVNAYYAG